jgi:hypothetical protein
VAKRRKGSDSKVGSSSMSATSTSGDPIGARALLKHCVENGIPVSGFAREMALSNDVDDQKLGYAELASNVAPAKPETIILLHVERQKRAAAKSVHRIYLALGPVPTARWMTLFVIVVLTSFVVLLGPTARSATTEVTSPPANDTATEPLGEEDLDNQTTPELDPSNPANEAWFLLTVILAASLGAAFSGLYQLQLAIEERRYSPDDDGQYTLRIVSGALAGTLLWLVGRNVVDDALALAPYALAILGGYGAAAVARILSRLVEGIEGAFAASTSDQVAVAQRQAQLDHEQRTVEALRILAEARSARRDDKRIEALDRLWQALGGGRPDSTLQSDDGNSDRGAVFPLVLEVISGGEREYEIEVRSNGKVTRDGQEVKDLRDEPELLSELQTMAWAAVEADIPSAVDGIREGYSVSAGREHTWRVHAGSVPRGIDEMIEHLKRSGS